MRLKFNPILWISIILVASQLASDASAKRLPVPRPNCKADIFVLIDSSDSINKNDFEGPLKRFLRQFINEVDFNYYRMELIRYSSRYNVVTHMTDRRNRLLQGALNMRYKGSWNKMHKPLNYVADRVYNYMGKRYQNVIIITQDVATNEKKTRKAINRLRKYKARILGVSVGDDAIDQLKTFVQSPVKHAFQVPNYRKLTRLTGVLVTRLCPLPQCYADIYICVDSSDSIGKSNFNGPLKQGLLNFIAALNMKSARVEVIKFADEAMMVQKLTHNEEKLIDSIKYMEYEGSKTNMHKCFKQVKRDLRLDENRGQVILLLTDGFATRKQKTLDINFQMKRLGVYFFTIGYGQDASLKEMKELASNPKKGAYKVKTVKEAGQVATSLVPRMCYAPSCYSDVYFLIDSSESVGKDAFEKDLKPVLKTIVKRLNLKQAAVSIIRFADKAKLILPLTQKRSRILSAIDAMAYKGFKTNTHLGFDMVGESLQKKNGGRKSVVLLMTDGYASKRKKAMEAAKKLKNRGGFILVTAIGEFASYKQAQEFATDKNFDAFKVKNYKSLKSIAGILATRVCYPQMKSKTPKPLPPIKPDKPKKKEEKPKKKDEKKPEKPEKPEKKEKKKPEKKEKKKPEKKEKKKPEKKEKKKPEKKEKKKPEKKEKKKPEKKEKKKPEKKEKKKPEKKEKKKPEKKDKKEPKKKEEKPKKKEEKPKKEKPSDNAPECKPKKLANEDCTNDVYIVVDLNRNIKDSKVDKRMVKGIKKLIKYVDVRVTRVALVTYSARAQMVVKMTRSYTKLKKALKNLSFNGGISNTFAALKLVESDIKKSESNGRTKHIVLFTGAVASDECRTIEEVKRLKSKKVYIQAIAVGSKASLIEIKLYATNPLVDAYEMNRYSPYKMIAYDISVSICPPYCKRDIYFVIDNSRAITREYFYGPIRSILYQFMNGLTGIGSRLSIISYANDATLELPMTNNTVQIYKALENLPLSQRYTKNLFKAYKMVRREVSYYQHNRKSVIIIMGDGTASDKFYSQMWKKKVTRSIPDISIYGVAIGPKAQRRKLARFTTGGLSGTLRYDGLRSVKTIANSLVSKVCPLYEEDKDKSY